MKKEKTTEKGNKKIFAASITAAGLIALLGTMGASLAAEDATQGQYGQENKEERRANMEAHREEMDTIFENNDYEAWENLMTEKADEMSTRLDEFKTSINQEIFEGMDQVHELMQSGDREAAQALREELGLPGGPEFDGKGIRGGKGMHGGRGMGQGERMHDTAWEIAE